MRYVEIVAKDHYEFGYRLGRQTAKLQRAFLKAFPFPAPVEALVQRSMPFLRATKQIFPHYIQEVRGLAHGAGVPFEVLWVLHCLDELEHKSFTERCSSVFIKKSDGHYLIGHNEDWDDWTKPYYYIQKRTVDRKTVMELGLCGTITGGTVSVNSYGIYQTINTLYHADFQIGVPKMIIARWLSSRRSIEEIKQNLPAVTRASGYCFNISDGKRLLSIESSAKRQSFFETEESYVHTNHYIGHLKKVEDPGNGSNTPSRGRYDYIKSRLGSIKDRQDLQDLLLYRTDDNTSVYRTTETATVASIIFEPENKLCLVTQENKGKETRWDKHSLTFVRD